MSGVEEGYCPSCGRYVGSYEICPYCGARVRTRISLKALMIFALVVSVVGVGALYYASHSAEAPTILIQDIKPEMNYARVKIVGYAMMSSTFDETSGRLYFSMCDINMTYNEHFGVSSIMVYVYAPTSRDIVEAGMAPISGDKITVIGTLKIRETPSLIINNVEDLILMREEPVNVSIQDIAYGWGQYLGKSVRIQGWITDYSNKTTFILASLKDYNYSDYELSVYIPEIVVRWTGKMTEFFLGDKVEIVGNIWEYRDEPEIVPWNATSIKRIKKLGFTELGVVLENSDTYAEQGRIVKINASISSWDDRYPNSLYVKDYSLPPSVTINVWIDFEVWDALNSTQRTLLNTKNKWIVVIGECKYYNDKLEIYIGDSSWILFELFR